MKGTEKQIKEDKVLIEKFGLKLAVKDGKECLRVSDSAGLNKTLNKIKENKSDIIEILKNRSEKPEGVKEIEDAEWNEEHFRDNFNKAFESEDAAVIQSKMEKPSISSAELKEQYPVAAAWLKIRHQLEMNSNAKIRLAAGEAMDIVKDDYKKALEILKNAIDEEKEEYMNSRINLK